MTLVLRVQGSADADLAYARLEALCGAVKGELQQDLHIHDAAVLPNFVNLPQVTAAEYGRVRAIPCQAAIHQLVLSVLEHKGYYLGSSGFQRHRQGISS